MTPIGLIQVSFHLCGTMASAHSWRENLYKTQIYSRTKHRDVISQRSLKDGRSEKLTGRCKAKKFNLFSALCHYFCRLVSVLKCIRCAALLDFTLKQLQF